MEQQPSDCWDFPSESSIEPPGACNYNYNYVDIIGDELSKSIYRLLVYCLHGDEVIAETSPEVS